MMPENKIICFQTPEPGIHDLGLKSGGIVVGWLPYNHLVTTDLQQQQAAHTVAQSDTLTVLCICFFDLTINVVLVSKLSVRLLRARNWLSQLLNF